MPAYRIASTAAKEEKEAYLHFDNFFSSLRFQSLFSSVCQDRFIICDRKKRNWITGTL